MREGPLAMSTTQSTDAVTEVKAWLSENCDPERTVPEGWGRLGA